MSKQKIDDDAAYWRAAYETLNEQHHALDRDFVAAIDRAEQENKRLREALKSAEELAANFPANIHGNLPVNPVECAEQVAREIASAIRINNARAALKAEEGM